MHISVVEETQEILFVYLTKEYVSDTAFVPEIMVKRKGVEMILMDGSADIESLYKLAYRSRIDLLTPPKKNAKKRDEPWMQDRTRRLLEILG